MGSLLKLLPHLLVACIPFLVPLPLYAQSSDLAAESHRAKELMAAGKFKEAIPIYRDLVRALPTNPGFIMNLGMALYMAGQDQEAIQQFGKVLKLEPGHVPALLFLGEAYLALGQPEKAIGPLEKVVRAQPNHPEARRMLAEAFFSLERLEPAAEQFRKLSELTPEDPKAWNGLGLSYQALSRQNFEQLGKIAPGSAYWLALAAESRMKDKQNSSAFYLYRQALNEDPRLRGVHAAIAEIYRNTGHLDWAAVEERKGKEETPPDCEKEKLECDFIQGRYLDLIQAGKDEKTPESFFWQSRARDQLAFEAFSRLTKLAPSAELHELIARVEFGRKHYVQASKEWREALKFSPGDPRVQKELAVALKMAGDHAGARELLEKLLERDPNSAEVNYLLGDTLLLLQRVEEAVPFLKKAVGLDSRLLEAHRSLARTYLQLGKGSQAIPHLKAALPLDEDGSLHYQLARAYQANGKQQLANGMLEKYRKMSAAAAAEKQATQEEVEIAPP